MLYRKIKPIDSKIIKRFANIYGFPHNDDAMELFCDVNGGKPIGLNFKYLNEQNEFVEVNVRRLLSFNPDDRYNIKDNIENFTGFDETIVPFAVDWEDNYICYINDNDTENIKFYINDECIWFDMYNENEELYTLETFFNDLGSW